MVEFNTGQIKNTEQANQVRTNQWKETGSGTKQNKYLDPVFKQGKKSNKDPLIYARSLAGKRQRD